EFDPEPRTNIDGDTAGDIRAVSDFNSGFVREIDVLVREARTGV
ncbi:unnamed protein product, partial [Linum tenue]